MSQNWGILQSCNRCRYGKSHEPILIFSKDRGPRVILDHNKRDKYVRKGDCIGFQKCGKCFEVAIDKVKDSTIPCEWKKF